MVWLTNHADKPSQNLLLIITPTLQRTVTKNALGVNTFQHRMHEVSHASIWHALAHLPKDTSLGLPGSLHSLCNGTTDFYNLNLSPFKCIFNSNTIQTPKAYPELKFFRPGKNAAWEWNIFTLGRGRVRFDGWSSPVGFEGMSRRVFNSFISLMLWI